MTERYNILMILTHWIMAFLIIGLLAIGIYMTNLPGEDPLKYESLYPLHKSFGSIALILILLRFPLRLLSKIPPTSDEISDLEALLSKITHFTIYLLMFIMPFSGYIASDAGGYGVKLFDYALPSFFAEKNESLSHFAITVHSWAGYAFVAILALHIVAPFKHYLFEKVNLFKRMV